MNIFPAIDLFEGKAVRLFKGDYAQMTVYHENPVEVAKEFERQGASYLHLVDLEGAKNGDTPNLDTISKIVSETNLFTEVGGGIRSMDTIRAYLNIGVNRVILGTAAVNDPQFLQQAVTEFGAHVAVGVDIRDGYVAIKGWTEQSQYTCDEFFAPPLVSPSPPPAPCMNGSPAAPWRSGIWAAISYPTATRAPFTGGPVWTPIPLQNLSAR